MVPSFNNTLYHSFSLLCTSMKARFQDLGERKNRNLYIYYESTLSTSLYQEYHIIPENIREGVNQHCILTMLQCQGNKYYFMTYVQDA